jgi:hypothetical protein
MTGHAVDSRNSSGGARTWPIAGCVALTALAGVLMATPYLARAEPRGAVGERRGPGPAPGAGSDSDPAPLVPDAGATDEPAVPSAEASSDPGRKVTGYVELLPDVAIQCLAHPRNTDRTGRSHDPRLWCAEVEPRSRRARGPFRGRPLFWG